MGWDGPETAPELQAIRLDGVLCLFCLHFVISWVVSHDVFIPSYSGRITFFFLPPQMYCRNFVICKLSCMLLPSLTGLAVYFEVHGTPQGRVSVFRGLHVE